MAKTFTELTQPGQLVAAFGAKTTIVNSGTAPLIITDDVTDEGLKVLSSSAKRATLMSLYTIQPGDFRSLPTGTYNIDFNGQLGRNAVVAVEMKDKASV